MTVLTCAASVTVVLCELCLEPHALNSSSARRYVWHCFDLIERGETSMFLTSIATDGYQAR